jgi:hypothetical protein
MNPHPNKALPEFVSEEIVSLEESPKSRRPDPAYDADGWVLHEYTFAGPASDYRPVTAVQFQPLDALGPFVALTWAYAPQERRQIILYDQKTAIRLLTQEPLYCIRLLTQEPL